MQHSSSARIMPKKKYILGDFAKYATGRLATHYAAISDMTLYNFSEKLYLDEKHNTRRCHMLLVGHYSRKASGPPVWACATGEKICYYSESGKLVTPLVQDIHSSKVYYDPPFSYIGGSHDYSSQKPGMNPERKLERAVVDSTINFIFLLSGRLEQVFDLVNPDILGHFKLACTNVVRHDEPHAGDTSYEQASESTVSASPTNGRLHSHEPIAFAERNLQLAHRNKGTGSSSLGKRQFVDLSDDLTDDLLTATNKRTRLLEQISNYDTEIHAKYAREIRELGAQLEQQRNKIDDAREKLTRERTRRRQAQVERETWREKCIEQQALSESAAKNVKQEEGSEDWKAMLFEQEKKTEHYKLKYIALKEEKRAWQLQFARQEMITTQPTDEVTSKKASLTQNNGLMEGQRAQFEHANEMDQGKNAILRTRQMLYKELRKCLTKYWEEGDACVWELANGRTWTSSERRTVILDEVNKRFQIYVNKEYVEDQWNEDKRTALYSRAVGKVEHMIEQKSFDIGTRRQVLLR